MARCCPERQAYSFCHSGASSNLAVSLWPILTTQSGIFLPLPDVESALYRKDKETLIACASAEVESQQQFLKMLVAAQRVKPRLYFEEDQPLVSIFKSLFQTFKRLIHFVERRVN